MVPVPPTTGMLWHWLHDVPLNLGPSPSPAVSTERKSSRDRKSTRLNSSHGYISYAVFCLKKKKTPTNPRDDGRRESPHRGIHERPGDTRPLAARASRHPTSRQPTPDLATPSRRGRPRLPR